MSSDVNIAVIDNGINIDVLNKELEKTITVDKTNSCIKDNLELSDTDCWHGTMCALIIDKYYPKCILCSVRILNDEGKGETEKIEPALEWCCQNNIRLVNLSLGTTHFNDNVKLNRLINKYVNKGLIIVAAISNAGFYTFPASYTNVIGVATMNSPLLYNKDYIHLGIDVVVHSEHTVETHGIKCKSTLSNSYAAPYVTALIAQKISNGNNYNIVDIKKYIKQESLIDIIDGLCDPDWVYKAYIPSKQNGSKADYYFEEVTGSYEDIQGEVDTVILCFKTELNQIDMQNKNLIYLGDEDIENIHMLGFKWSRQTRVKQIINNQYRGNGLEIPLIVLELADSLDKYYILSKFRDLFGNDGYNTYTVSMEPESVLYGIEYIPDIQMPMTNRLVTDFIEGQVFYKQSDLILWNVSKGQKENICSLYPDCDVEILINEGEIYVYIEGNLIYTQVYSDLAEECIRTIYDVLVSYMAEEESE